MKKEKKVRINLEAPASIKEKAREQSKKLLGSENISQYICFLINNDPPR